MQPPAGQFDATIDKLAAKLDLISLELVKTQGSVASMGERLENRLSRMESRILAALRKAR